MILKKKWRKLSCVVLAASVLMSTWSGTPVAFAAGEPTLTMVSQEALTYGAILKRYEWQSTRKNKEFKVDANVIEVDLTNPNVKIDVMSGKNNQFTKKQSVLGMAKETHAVAGVNGDFYNTQAEGVPIGPQISNGKLMATPPYLPGFYSFAIDKNNKPIVDLFTFRGSMIAGDGATYPLGGINKTYYWFEPGGEHSHIDGLFMYTNAWGQIDRSNDGVTNPTEVLVQNGIVKQIADNGIIQMIAPEDGYILRAAGKAADFVRLHLKQGEPIKADYQVLPQDGAKQYDVSGFKMMIGGHTILVDEGQPSAFSREVASLCCTRSRTAIGYSKDQRVAYIITADYSGDSKGLSMQELQQFMIQVGVWKGMNLDGGGSTQMVARPLGEFDPILVNSTEGGFQRQVVNGVGVYSLAPKAKVKELFVQSPSFVFIGEQAPLSFKAYDDYYNPVETDKVESQWSAADGMGTFKNNIFTAAQAGIAKVTAASGSGTSTGTVNVVGRNQLKSLRIGVDQLALSEGGSYKIPVMATTMDGKTREVPPELIQWEVLGIKGEVTNGVLKVSGLAGSTGVQLIAKYDGFNTTAFIPVGVDKVWYDLDRSAVLTNSQGKPAGVVASVSTKPDEKGNKYLELGYDFTQGRGTKWAYATLDTNILIEGEPRQMKVKVNGDESRNWLRAEILDNSGKIQYADLARNINWKGWKELTADFSELDLKYPIRIKSIYVVDEEVGQDERSAKGAVGIDDITFTYRGSEAPASLNAIQLTINNKNVSVNGKGMTLEQAPVIVDGNTLIPIRFATDALGGTVRWDEKERRVTVIRGGKLVDLWIGSKDLIVNGQRVAAEVAPAIMSDLTMVPLRILSENLGWKVTWDAKSRQVTLQ